MERALCLQSPPRSPEMPLSHQFLQPEGLTERFGLDGKSGKNPEKRMYKKEN